MKVKFKKLNPNAETPCKAHPADAGFDLSATSCTTDEFGNVVYGTGIAVEIPDGHVGLVFPRSSICKHNLLLTNSVGVIDSNYRGEITAKFTATAGNTLPDLYTFGDRIAQLIIIPYPDIEFDEVSELSETDRGTGGYGSTGK